MTKLKPLLKHFSPESCFTLRKIKGLTALGILTISITACHTQQQSTDQQKPPFTLLEASSQNWTAGREEGGRGTEYYFKMVVKKNNITFDSMWVDNKALPIFIAKETTTVSNNPITYSKGDTIILRGTALAHAATSLQPDLAPGAARIRYHVNDKPAYYTIEHVEKKESLNLPTRN